MLRSARAGRTGSLVLDTEFRGKLEGRLARDAGGCEPAGMPEAMFRELSWWLTVRLYRQVGTLMLWQNLGQVCRKA